jgi:hypothetical protein
MKILYFALGCAIPVSLCDCCGSRPAVPVLPFFFMLAVFVLLPQCTHVSEFIFSSCSQFLFCCHSVRTGVNVFFLLVVLVLAPGSDFSWRSSYFLLVLCSLLGGCLERASERVFSLWCGLARESAWSGSCPMLPAWSWRLDLRQSTPESDFASHESFARRCDFLPACLCFFAHSPRACFAPCLRRLFNYAPAPDFGFRS